MKYQEIIDTIKAGDYVEVKGDPSFEDGVYKVDVVDVFDDGASVKLWNNRDRFWVYDKCIVRKISDGELSSNDIKQNSQKENDSSHIGNSDPKNWNGIVVGSEWEFIGEDRGLFTPGKSYIVKYAYPIEACLVDEQGDNHYFTINTFSDYFKPVEQTSAQLKEQLTSHEPSGGVVKVGAIRDPEPQSCVKLQYDPRDVAFTKDTFPQDTLTKHYNFSYTLTEDDVEAGCLKLDPYFVSQQWKLGKKDDTGVLFHCLKTLARFGDKNDIEREIKALNAQVKRLAELHNVKL